MVQYRIGDGLIELDERGYISRLETSEGKKLLTESGSFFRLGREGNVQDSIRAEAIQQGMRFHFPNGGCLEAAMIQMEGYLRVTVTRVEGDGIENILFGPVMTSLDETIGDVVGVVQGQGTAIGVSALNMMTLPGFPREYPLHPAVDTERVLSMLSVDAFSIYDSAAYFSHAGSMLQLYSEERRRYRRRDIMGTADVEIPPMAALPDYDGGTAGMSFALFCCCAEPECLAKQALERIGQIECAEGLPHPIIDGEWAKTSRKSMAAYLISEFSPENLEKLLGYTKRAGFTRLYHPEPFQEWGHFTLRPDQFPQGDSSMKECCRKAEEQGIGLGVHTLTSFTTTNDSYVTPIPHPSLAKYGSRPLSAAVSREDTEIQVSDTGLYEIMTTLQTVQIDQELIVYQKAQDGRLIGCQRGAFHTEEAAHAAGAAVHLLCDYPYKVFFPDISLQDAYTQRLGELFRNTGLSQISFDGLEGCSYTGEDWYGCNRFCSRCWEDWENPGIINDASRLGHNLWHMHTRMNWGEPWGAKMREGMLEGRMRNQDFFKRNLFPRMLGWFLVRRANRKFEATNLQDIEWALSMSAGFDAGYALVADEKVLDTLGCTGDILDAVRRWEQLRLSGVLSEALRERLRDPGTEWHLEETEDGFLLYPLHISKPMVCDLLEMQPGQPGGADWSAENPFEEQEYDMILRVEGYGRILSPSLYTSKGMLKFSGAVQGGQYLIYRQGKALRTDRNYNALEELTVTGTGILDRGIQHLGFACDFDGEEGPEVTVRLLTYGSPEKLPKG